MSDIKINEATYPLKNGKIGKIAVLMYCGDGDPRPNLDWAVSQYVGDEDYFEAIDSGLDNPWTRVVISNINDMEQMPFNDYIERRTRQKKLEIICK